MLSYENASGLVYTEIEDKESELIFLKPSCIDYFVLGILEYEVKKAADAELGETAYVEEFIGVDLEYD